MAGCAGLADGLGTMAHNWPLRAHGARASMSASIERFRRADRVPSMQAQHPLHSRRNVRLDTLVRLRWLAVLGQTAAVLVVHYVFDFQLPLTACLAVIGCSAALNVALRLLFRPVQRLEPGRPPPLLPLRILSLPPPLFLTRRGP